jgi:hypothetical protein
MGCAALNIETIAYYAVPPLQLHGETAYHHAVIYGLNMGYDKKMCQYSSLSVFECRRYNESILLLIDFITQ